MKNENKAYTVGLYTLGCKVSLYETEAIGEAFADAGYELRSFDDVCDVYVINTCTVTAESDAKSRKYIRRATRKNPRAVVIAVGCYTQRSPHEAAAIPGVSAVIGTADKLSAVRVADRLLSERDGSTACEGGDTEKISREHSTDGARRGAEIYAGSLDKAGFEPMMIKHAPRTRAYVKIEDGCECKCTYCAISPARGPVRSKKPEDVIAEVRGLCRGGTREIVLTGIETGSYGADLDCGCDLADLIGRIDALGCPERIRLGSMAPELMGEKFIDKIAGLSVMVPHFHISMQSGSDNVLRRMKRRYNRRMALENVERIKKYMPGVMLTADLMVGFPGESEEDFLDTVSFVREARLLDAHVFAYSRRAGTPAADYPDQVAEAVKRERSARLIEVCHRVRDEVLSGVVMRAEPLSCILETFADGVWTAHSDSYIEVRVECDPSLHGQIVSVVPTHHENGIVYGKIAE